MSGDAVTPAPALPTLDAARGVVPIPVDATAVFVSGSVVSGWSHALSDIDLYVVTEAIPSELDESHVMRISSDPPEVAVLATFAADGARWDVEYWLDRQISQLLAKATAAATAGSTAANATLGWDEQDLLYRLSIGVPLIGDEWLAARQAELNDSAYATSLVRIAADQADGLMEDAVGQLQSGDVESAVLAAQLAFGRLVDAVLASEGDMCPSAKWRARRVRQVQPRLIDWDQFWEIQTMATYSERTPAEWVEAVVRACQAIMCELEVG